MTLKDLLSLGATDAAKAGQQLQDIQRRLVHTSSKTSEIYIKQAVPDVSAIDMKLPWLPNTFSSSSSEHRRNAKDFSG